MDTEVIAAAQRRYPGLELAGSNETSIVGVAPWRGGWITIQARREASLHDGENIVVSHYLLENRKARVFTSRAEALAAVR